jgi:NAD-dependent SIR2 family protein deacetylase
MQAPRIAWLLGAGASAAAGVPTAFQATWDWKSRIFATEKNVRRDRLDLANPLVRRQIQRHFDQQDGSPAEGSDDEYSYYFERAYPRAEDRRAYIDQMIALGKPAYGHFALAALMSLNKVGVVWTTNFDRVIEDAAARVAGRTGMLTVATIDSAQIAQDALRDQRLPLLVKLHGDYQSDRLKNITTELQAQDGTLREALRRASARYGLAVVGYSGRDASVMEALRQGLDEPGGYAAGIYWFIRSQDQPAPVVEALITDAQAKGISAQLIRFDTFDDLVGRLLTPHRLPAEVEHLLNTARPAPRLSAFGGATYAAGTFPVLRFNALLVESYPTTARRIAITGDGGTKDIREALRTINAKAIAIRRHDGVAGFGLDADLARGLTNFQIDGWDQAPLNPFSESSDLGLLYDALLRALLQRRPFLAGSGRRLAVDPAQSADPGLDRLRTAAGALTGQVPNTPLRWSEGVELRLEARMGQLWLVFEPTISIPRSEDPREIEARKEFIRSRVAGRYNGQTNPLFQAWGEILGSGDSNIAAYGLEGEPGIDASFRINSTTAFSRSR